MLFPSEFSPFVTIIGDIKGSRKLKNRHDVQNRLQQVLDNINHTYAKEISSSFMITLGDEFQGLLNSGASAVYITDYMERELYPTQLRFGIGVGEIATDIRSKTIEIDGPAYYLAREAIDTLKAIETKKMEPKQNIEIRIQHHMQLSTLLNTMFSLLTVIKASWTPRQVEVINAYFESNGTQTDTARMLHVLQSNVQKVLTAADFYTYQSAMDTLANTLSGLKGDTHV